MPESSERLPTDLEVKGPIFRIEGEDNLQLTNHVLMNAAKEGLEAIKSMVAPENFHSYTHGDSWSGSTKELDGTQKNWVNEFGTQSAEVALKGDSIRAADFSQLQELADHFRDQFRDGMTKSVFASITEDLGEEQTTRCDLKNAPGEAILESLQKIHIGLNADLSPSLPQLAVPQSLFDEIALKLKALEDDPEFREKHETLLLQKWVDALIRHFETEQKFNLEDDNRSAVNDRLQRLREIRQAQLLRKRCPAD